VAKNLNVTGVRAGFDYGKRAMVQNAANATGRASSLRDPAFQEKLKQANISLKETPGAFLGAYSARMLGDIAADEFRGKFWQINHPLAIADKLIAAGIDPEGKLPRYTSSLIAGAIMQPAIAATGAYDPTNIAELGRPKGFKQNEPTSEDFKKSRDPATELFERFVQGRQGRPLKEETAREEIPGLTHQRYANYMQFLYNDPAFLGILKATPENLQGVPEARVFGYPVSIPSATAFAGGLLGAKLGLASVPYADTVVQPSILFNEKDVVSKVGSKPGARGVRGAVGGLAGSFVGVMAGNLINQSLAAKQLDSQLPMS
jgi:hypothetical protein